MEQSKLAVPVAILIAGVIIGGGVYFGLQSSQRGAEVIAEAEGVTGDLEQMKPISNDDHIRGNPDAPVKIVEYSDFECPFCKRFHDTMKQVMDEYEESGKVAWVYRHFPLEQLHPLKAQKEAVATECANEQGGNDAFWKYTDRFFELTPSNNQTDIDTVLPQIASEIGLDIATFNECLASAKYDRHIEDEVQNAAATGGNGTPWSIVVAESGKKYPLSGAQPYEAVKQLIEITLKDI